MAAGAPARRPRRRTPGHPGRDPHARRRALGRSRRAELGPALPRPPAGPGGAGQPRLGGSHDHRAHRRILRPPLSPGQHGGGGGRRPRPPGGRPGARVPVRRRPRRLDPRTPRSGRQGRAGGRVPSGHRADPSGAGGPVRRPTGPAALRPGRGQPRAGGRSVQPAVPGDQGAARAGLLGLVRAGGLPGRRLGQRGYGDGPRTRGRGARHRLHRAGPTGGGGHHRAGVGHCQGKPPGGDPAGLRGLGGQDELGSAPASCSTGRYSPWTRCWSEWRR